MTDSQRFQDEFIHTIMEMNIEKVKEFLEAGANPSLTNKTGMTPLMVAVGCWDIEMIDLLLLHGANINQKGLGGMTPLHWAIDIAIDGTIQSGGMPGEEPTEIVEYLLSLGASISVKDDRGKTPIDWALDYNSNKVATLLQKQ